MKNLFIYLCFFVCILSGIHAQEIKVSGTVRDFQSKNGIPGATIRLLERDSTFIEGCVTDKAGKFILTKIPQGNSYIIVSFVGYDTETIYLKNIRKDTQVGDILLTEFTEHIDEVVVSAEHVINKVNRQIIFPTKMQTEASFSAFELLGKMMLPALLVDATRGSISSLNNGGVQLRINDVKASIQEVQALLSTQVVKVEYINMPGVRYGEGLAAVVNFVAKRTDSGFTGGINLRNAVNTGYGNDNTFMKYNHKASEFAVNYSASYRNFNDKHTDIYQSFVMANNEIRSLNKEGINAPYKLQNHNLSFTYNYANENSVLNVQLGNAWMHAPFYNTIYRIQETGRSDIDAYTGIKDKSFSPTLNMYFQQKLSSTQTLTANMVGTHISSDYLRDYTEYADKSVPILSSTYTVGGDKYSLISELIYEKSFSNLLWSSGINYKQAYTENVYEGSTGDVTTSMRESEVYAYTELDGKIKKLNYNMGIGLSRQYFSENTHRYSYYTIRPSISLSYPLLKKVYLRYSFRINPLLPGLTRLSDVHQWQNAYEVLVGNPNLKPYRAYINNFSVHYSAKRFTIYASGYYQYNHKPITSTAVKRIDEGEQTYFVYGYDNQKSYTHLQGLLYAQVKVIGSSRDFLCQSDLNFV